MARLLIGCEAPCELHWLAGGKGGGGGFPGNRRARSGCSGSAGAEERRSEYREIQSKTGWRLWLRKPAWAQVGPCAASLGSSLARLPARTGLGKVCCPIGLAKRRGLEDALGGLGGLGGVGCFRECHLDTGFEYQGAARLCRGFAPKPHKRALGCILLP